MKLNFKLIKNNCWIGGVCSGIAYILGTNTWIIRLIFFAFSSVLITPYILLWIFVPEYDIDPPDYKEKCE
jgi:phage shock protein PspC (stress-responsive transcriptional regulator)